MYNPLGSFPNVRATVSNDAEINLDSAPFVHFVGPILVLSMMFRVSMSMLFFLPFHMYK